MVDVEFHVAEAQELARQGIDGLVDGFLAGKDHGAPFRSRQPGAFGRGQDALRHLRRDCGPGFDVDTEAIVSRCRADDRRGEAAGVGDAADGGSRPHGKTAAPGDFAARDADPRERRAGDLAARGELQGARVDDGRGIRRFFGEQFRTVVSYLRDGNFDGESCNAGVFQNVRCKTRVEDGYGWQDPVLRTMGANTARRLTPCTVCEARAGP